MSGKKIIIFPKIKYFFRGICWNKIYRIEQIFREDQDEKKHNTPKFQIDLLVRDNSLITIVQNGLISYFNNNEYIKTYQTIYNETNNDIIISIDEEIKELRSLRNTQNSTIDFSTHTILSSRDEMDIQNQIIDLKHKKSIIITNNEMLKPITFVEDFSLTTIEEREVIVWGSAQSVFCLLYCLLLFQLF